MERPQSFKGYRDSCRPPPVTVPDSSSFYPILSVALPPFVKALILSESRGQVFGQQQVQSEHGYQNSICWNTFVIIMHFDLIVRIWCPTYKLVNCPIRQALLLLIGSLH